MVAYDCRIKAKGKVDGKMKVFSHAHVTLYEGQSVRPSVCRSVRPSVVRLPFFYPQNSSQTVISINAPAQRA